MSALGQKRTFAVSRRPRKLEWLPIGVEILQEWLLHSAADRNAELPVYGRDPFLALRHFIEPPSFTNLISRPVNAFWRKPCRALFHQVRFASNSLTAVSFLTLATAASIPSVVLLRRLRIRRAKSL